MSSAWAYNRIVERAWEMACITVELHAITIDYSSMWDRDLGFECWQCIQQLLVYNYNRREEKKTISPSLVITLYKSENSGTSISQHCYNNVYRTNSHH